MTRADQWAAAWRAAAAVLAVAAITVAAGVDALRIGAAAAGLLYLLPVLWASARGGLNAGLATAAAAAFCYNFFLLEPRYTLRIHGVGDVAAFVVLTVVAVVTSRLAADLGAREAEARRRAAASEAETALATQLARLHDPAGLDRAALEFLADHIGEAHLVRAADLTAKSTGLSPLDAAAAAWALYNGAASGAGTTIMPAADYHFASLGPDSEEVLALRVAPAGDPRLLESTAGLARVWRQARDRLAVDRERQAREAAETRDRLRRTLLAALGHDFRTPLTILKSSVAELPGAAAAELGREVDRLVRLSDDLLASARLEAGTPVATEAVDLVDAVASALPAAGADGTTIRIDLPDDLPLVRAEPVLLVHVLVNLLDNAVRHARSEVVIAGRSERGRVRVEVRDDGPGVDPAVAERMFDRFVAAPDRGTGSGLGLAIARDLASAMGAGLSAGTGEAGGACFALVLDAAEPHGEVAA